MCRVHGGASTGPNTPNTSQNARKHGIYGRTIRPSEEGVHADMRTAVGGVDDELALCRLQLHRTLEAQNAAAELPSGLELVKSHVREASEYGPGDEEVRERVDYNAHIDRLTARIAFLEKTRVELLIANGDNTDADGLTTTDTFIAPDEPIPEKPIL